MIISRKIDAYVAHKSISVRTEICVANTRTTRDVLFARVIIYVAQQNRKDLSYRTTIYHVARDNRWSHTQMSCRTR